MIPLSLALSSKKLLADFDAPAPPEMRSSSHTDGWLPACPKCEGAGFLYHAGLPTAYAIEPCTCVTLEMEAEWRRV